MQFVNFMEYFGTTAGFVAGVLIVVQFLNNLLHVEKTWGKRLVSWLVPIAGAAVSYGFQLGFFADLGDTGDALGWVMASIFGLSAGLVANGIYDIDQVRGVLEYIIKTRKPEVINE